MPTPNENTSRKISVKEVTVKQLIEMLQALPSEQQDWSLTCCGSSYFWIHRFPESKCVTIDHEEYLDDDDDEE